MRPYLGPPATLGTTLAGGLDLWGDCLGCQRHVHVAGNLLYRLMASYRAHFLTHADDTFSVSHFEMGDDEAAIAHALGVLCTGIGKVMEIWQDERLVHVEIYP